MEGVNKEESFKDVGKNKDFSSDSDTAASKQHDHVHQPSKVDEDSHRDESLSKNHRSVSDQEQQDSSHEEDKTLHVKPVEEGPPVRSGMQVPATAKDESKPSDQQKNLVMIPRPQPPNPKPEPEPEPSKCCGGCCIL